MTSIQSDITREHHAPDIDPTMHTCACGRVQYMAHVHGCNVCRGIAYELKDVTRRCAECGRPMPNDKPKAVYCGHTCYHKAWRRRTGRAMDDGRTASVKLNVKRIRMFVESRNLSLLDIDDALDYCRNWTSKSLSRGSCGESRAEALADILGLDFDDITLPPRRTGTGGQPEGANPMGLERLGGVA